MRLVRKEVEQTELSGSGRLGINDLVDQTNYIEDINVGYECWTVNLIKLNSFD